MNKRDVESLFDEVFEDAVKETPEMQIPDFQPSWEQMHMRLERERKTQAVRKSIRRMAIIASSFVLGAALFGTPVVTKAFNPFYQTIKEWPGEIVSFFFGRQDRTEEGAKTAPPSKSVDDILQLSGQLQTIETTLDDARNQLAFPVPVFEYIPQGYELQKTELNKLPNKNTAKEVHITFTNESNIAFWVALQLVDGDITIGSGANQADIQKIQLKHGVGFLATAQDGTSKLEFFKQNVYVMIIGKLDIEEIIKVAENM